MNLFNIIKNKNEYWLVDQIKMDFMEEKEYQHEFTQILDEWNRQGVGYLSLLMDETLENWLLSEGFKKISSIVEYTRKLDELSVGDSQIRSHALSDGLICEEEYAELYDLCRTGSANKNKQQEIAQVMQSLKNELGANWCEHCYYFTMDESMVGISIPHIEMGTADEGRLFYFGVVPSLRGKGFGSRIHNMSLWLLKQLPANYYVGSTDIHNTNMVSIFERNGCRLRDRKGIYRIEN